VKSHLEGNVLVGYVVVVGLDTGKHEGLVFWREELAFLGELRDGGQCGNANKDSDAAFDDEDPVQKVSFAVLRPFVQQLTISMHHNPQYRPFSRSAMTEIR
jgi:hypothetical protein